MTRAIWNDKCEDTFDGLLGPAQNALVRVAGDLEGWRFAALRAIIIDLASEAADARTQAELGQRPAAK